MKEKTRNCIQIMKERRKEGKNQKLYLNYEEKKEKTPEVVFNLGRKEGKSQNSSKWAEINRNGSKWAEIG